IAATILDGRALAKSMRDELRAEIQQFTADRGTAPALAVVQVAGDAASDSYVRTINKACDAAGIAFMHHLLPGDTAQARLELTVRALSADDTIDGLLLQLHEHATVTIAHSRTPDLAAVVREADIVAAAVGRAGIITGEMLKPGAVVVDFGINVLDDGRMVGDVDFESAAAVAGAITPVPGGTGPVTNVMLLRNVLQAARG